MPVKQYTWDPVTDSILEVTDGAGNILASYTNEPSAYGPMISEHRDGETRFHHFDALGSTRTLTDDSGTVTDTFTYDAWGNEVDRSGTSETPFRWVGQFGYVCDDYMSWLSVRRRQYMPDIAAWASCDPIENTFVIRDYTYAWRQPTMLTDPSGEWPLPLCSTTFCTLSGPLPGAFEGIYGLKAEVLSSLGQCCDGSTIRFTFKETHALPSWRTGRVSGVCGQPANDEITNGNIWPLRFGNITDRNCSPPRARRWKVGDCWNIQVEWECRIDCSGACPCSGECGPSISEIGIYPNEWLINRNASTFYSVYLRTTTLFDDEFCVLHGCAMSTTMEWRAPPRNFMLPIQAEGNCSAQDLDYLWMV